MKFIFDRKTVVNEVAVAHKIISTKNALSVLSNVLLTAEDGSLEITATDIKCGFRVKIPVETAESGSTTVLCDKFMGILSSIPDGDAEFSLQENGEAVVKSKSAKIKYTLKCMAQDKFPEITSSSSEKFFDVPAKDLKQMTARTSFSVSNDITRYFMSGVLFEKKDGKLVLVSTDGRRLSLCSRESVSTDTEFCPVIVPPKILNIVTESLSDEGNVSIAMNDKLIFFKFGNYEFSESLVDGHFPNYEKVIPQHNENEFSVQKSDLENALKHISVMTGKEGRFILKLSNGGLSVNATAEEGSAKEEIPCTYSGESISFTLSCKYMLDYLKSALNEDIVFKFSGNFKPILLKQNSAPDYIHVIMPMQV